MLLGAYRAITQGTWVRCSTNFLLWVAHSIHEIGLTRTS